MQTPNWSRESGSLTFQLTEPANVHWHCLPMCVPLNRRRIEESCSHSTAVVVNSLGKAVLRGRGLGWAGIPLAHNVSNRLTGDDCR